jgi:hypothetical protein
VIKFQLRKLWLNYSSAVISLENIVLSFHRKKKAGLSMEPQGGAVGCWPSCGAVVHGEEHGCVHLHVIVFRDHIIRTTHKHVEHLHIYLFTHFS